jgi:hypothetical protein
MGLWHFQEIVTRGQHDVLGGLFYAGPRAAKAVRDAFFVDDPGWECPVIVQAMSTIGTAVEGMTSCQGWVTPNQSPGPPRLGSRRRTGGSPAAAVIHSVPMRFGTFFFAYFWFSHRTAAGEASA